MVPRATYRVQFGKHFGFDDAAGLAPYLAELGVSHLYASPYLKARPNSPHGYDITDFNSLNPELGDQAAFLRMIEALKGNGLKHILDYVPNHMGVGGSDNPFWLDVLEWGTESVFADWFDVDWESHSEYLRGKLLVPFLGEQFGAVLTAGNLRLKYDAAAGEFAVWAYDVHKLPISPSSYALVLESDSPELKELGLGFGALPRSRPELMGRAGELKMQLAKLARERGDVGSLLGAAVERFHGVTGDAASWNRLDQLIKKQHWRATHYRVAADDINYRRFFNISDLAGIRMERQEVFEHSHRFVKELVQKGIVDGLRIDHIDGLFDPKEYLLRLRESTSTSLYLVVEKILARHETLRPDWPADGTTGYEFASQLTQLLVDPEAETRLTESYRNFTGERESFEAVVHGAKLRIMENEMASELFSLAREAARIARQNPASADFTENLLCRALKEIVAYFPVYRTYVDKFETQEIDRRYTRWAVAQASRSDSELDESAFDFWEKLLTGDLSAAGSAGYNQQSVTRLAMKVQQFSGPVMAKGFEDTALFRFNRLAALNEVGSSPDQFGSTVAAFHKENVHRAENWPRTLLTTSTHDTKHGEDARARLAALSLVPEEWAGMVAGWSRILRARRGDVEGTAAPSRNVEYLFFQNLIATWPVELTGSHAQSLSIPATYIERLLKATVKSMREARVNTNWVSPNIAYENAVGEFVNDTLDRKRSEVFLESFLPFQERVALIGVHNSLVQTVLKLTSPGVPDIYQGCELWNLSLVDPDNRRAIDYEIRRRMLKRVKEESRSGKREWMRSLLQNWQDGSIKLAIIHLLLEFRKANQKLFEYGTYEPLNCYGKGSGKVCGFVRKNAAEVMVVIVSTDARMQAASFGETRVQVNEAYAAANWCDLFTGRVLQAERGGFHLQEVFGELPVAVLVSPGAANHPT
jgi:(1->4)-alpha-D-glucan 1-alpha-D-glucosylmutase